jgi:hypothetical protein
MMEVRDEDISRDNTRLESTNAELRSHLIEATVRGTGRLGDRERLEERERKTGKQRLHCIVLRSIARIHFYIYI